MATLDFSDVLSSPEFIDQGSYIRTATVVGTNGMAVQTPAAPVAFYAIQLPGGSSMLRQADGSRLSGDLVIFTQTWLSDGLKEDDANSLAADIVLWHGRKYTVTKCQDFSAFSSASIIGVTMGGGIQIGQTGQGFWVCTADLLPLNPSSGA